MVIRVSNNITGRQTEVFNVDSGTTVGQWLSNNMPGTDPKTLKITINGAKADTSSVFFHDCTVTISADKLNGAAQVWNPTPEGGAATTAPAPAPAPVRRKKSLEVIARNDIIANILNGAREQCRSCGSDLVSQAVNQIAQLDAITQDHVRDATALVLNVMEQTKRFAAICDKDVAAVAQVEDVTPGEVSATKARVFNATGNQRALIRIYAALLAVYQLLGAEDKPSVLADLMPTPGSPA